MNTISLRIPSSLHEKVRKLAESEGTSINQFITLTLTEKTSALDAARYIEGRAKRGSIEKFKQAMAKVTDKEPDEADRLDDELSDFYKNYFQNNQVSGRETGNAPPNAVILYSALGLAGKAGEVANRAKDLIRDGLLDKHATAQEMGDVLLYLAELATDLGLDLDQIAKDNLARLADRKARGAISGSGDER